MRKGDLVKDENAMEFYGLYVQQGKYFYGFSDLPNALDARDLSAGGFSPEIILCPVELI